MLSLILILHKNYVINNVIHIRRETRSKMANIVYYWTIRRWRLSWNDATATETNGSKLESLKEKISEFQRSTRLWSGPKRVRWQHLYMSTWNIEQNKYTLKNFGHLQLRCEEKNLRPDFKYFYDLHIELKKIYNIFESVRQNLS